MPGGVNSPVRSWQAVGGHPRFVESARGSRISDVDGNSYIDYIGSWGPMLLGHAYPDVVRAVEEAAGKGTSFGACTETEVRLAETVCSRFASIDKLRLVSSGTEATMSALRLARAATGRDEIVKFEGCYHGHSDGLLVRAGSGATTLGVPDSPGVPQAVGALTRLAVFNDTPSLRQACNSRTAAVIVEPVAGNMGVVPPQEGFLRELIEIAHAAGALVIFDEVISGFRSGLGGYQQVAGLSPDLTCLGKVLGGGLPLGAYGGRADLMDQVAPAGPVYQAGTLAGNPVAVAAGLATLRAIGEAGFYERLESLSSRLEDGLRSALGNRPGCVQRSGSLLTLFFGPARVRNYDEATKADVATFARFFRAMLERRVWAPPSQFEAWFVSAAHSIEDVDDTVAAAHDAIASLDG